MGEMNVFNSSWRAGQSVEQKLVKDKYRKTWVRQDSDRTGQRQLVEVASCMYEIIWQRNRDKGELEVAQTIGGKREQEREN